MTRIGMLGPAILLGAALSAAPLVAQVAEPGQFAVSVDAGFVRADNAAALNNSGSLGVNLAYQLSEPLSIGAFFDVGRPTTVAAYFPRARHVHADTTFLYAVGQQVTQRHYGIAVNHFWYRDEVVISGMVGAGRYSILNDPEVMRENDRFGGNMFAIGASLSRALGELTAVQVAVRGYSFLGFDRDQLDPVHPLYRDALWHELMEGVPDKKETVHNLRFSIGFIYVPGGAW